MNRHVRCGLWPGVMCQPRFTTCDCSGAQVRGAEDRAGCARAGEGPCGKHVRVHLHFAGNLMLFFKSFTKVIVAEIGTIT